MINHKFEVEGEYCLTVKNHTNGTSRKIGPFKNLITNQGLNSFGGIPQTYNILNCFVGTGTTAPAPGDTDMAAKINVLALGYSGAQVLGVNEGAPNYSSLLTMQYNFAVGAVVGNISEVGVGRGVVSANVLTIQNLFSRSLIVDANGNPITITIFADESLTVQYYERTYPNLSDSTYVVVDQTTGISHTLTSRLYTASTFRNTSSGFMSALNNSGNDGLLFYYPTNLAVPITLAPITATSAFVGATAISASNSGTVTFQPYVADSFSRTSTVAIPLSAGNNANGIHGIAARMSTSSPGAIVMGTQVLINPPIMKTAQATLAIDIGITWSRRP